jgi:hypothetical protein
MPSRRLIGVTALVGAAFAAGVILLPHSPADLRELIVAAGVAAPAIALGAWILLTPAMFSRTVLAPSRWHEPRDARSSRRRSGVPPS